MYYLSMVKKIEQIIRKSFSFINFELGNNIVYRIKDIDSKNENKECWLNEKGHDSR